MNLPKQQPRLDRADSAANARKSGITGSISSIHHETGRDASPTGNVPGPVRRPSLCLSLLAVIAAAFLGTGCVTNGRQLLLKEYSASIPASPDKPLAGTTLCIQGFSSAPNLVSLELADSPEEPKSFQYIDMTHEQDLLWANEMKSLRKATPKDNWKEIGNLRNGFGMVMSHVYALNDPAAWLAESLKFDLEAQGAKVVDSTQSANADVTVSGTIQLCRTDMYMVVNGSLVVDLDLHRKDGTVNHKRIHTHGATAAMLASEGEYFHALRDARQKFSILAIREITHAAK
jgi:hypothetical protein